MFGAVQAVAIASAAALIGLAVGQASSMFGDDAPYVLIAVAVTPVVAALVMANPVLGVFGLFATFPFGSITVLPPLQTVELAVVFVGGAVMLQRLASGKTLLPWASPLWWMLALVAWTLVSLTTADDLTLAFKQVAQLVAGLVFACVVMAACASFADVRRILGGLVAIATTIVVAGVATGNTSQITARFSGQSVEGRLQGSFDQPNQLGSFCALTVLVAFGFVFGARTRRGRVAASLAAGLISVGLVLSLSRGAWIGFVLALLFLFVSLPQARTSLLVLGAPLVLLAVLLGAFAADRPEIEVVQLRARSITAAGPYDERPKIYREAWREIKQEPWVGYGPGNFPVASRRAASQSNDVSADHAHNIWLNWGAEAGLPAVAFLVGFCFAVALCVRRANRATRRKGDPRDHAIIVGLAGALVSVLGQGIFDYTLRNAVLFFAVWTLVGAVLVADREAREPSAPART